MNRTWHPLDEYDRHHESDPPPEQDQCVKVSWCRDCGVMWPDHHPNCPNQPEDFEEIGVDADGHAICWDAEKHQPYNTGE